MKMQIVSCPKCGTNLLHDTAQCHACGHVIDQRSAAQLKQIKSRQLPTDNAVAGDMQDCPSCGETCRMGLVRCWNCSTFLRPEIEASYRQKLGVQRRRVEHIDLPVIEATVVTEADSLQRAVLPNPTYVARSHSSDESDDDDGFDLSSEASFLEESSQSGESSLPLGLDNSQFADSPANHADNSDTFRLLPVEVTTVEATLPPASDASEPPLFEDPAEPQVQAVTFEPPIRVEEPPPSQQEVEVGLADDLLKIAANEELDIQKVRKTLRSKDTFVIFCPQGCKIRVQEKHRGRAGKCPRCQCEFVVPRKVIPKKENEASATTTEVAPISRYKKWLTDIRLHTVDPQKLRIKPDSLLNECTAVDLGFSEEDVILATLLAGKYAANAKKALPVRQAMIDHFLKQGTFDQLVAPAKKLLKKEALAQVAIAQPTPAGTESLFADIPVFGTNRIAVKIPKTPDSPHSQYLSFSLSEFRAFVTGMQTICGIEGFGSGTEIPLTEQYTTAKCSVSNVPVKELNQLNYYQADPTFTLEVTGWRCAGCKIVVSEAARADAKLGGANGKGIAKAKCPKCTQKMGNQPLYQLPEKSVETSPATQPEPAMA